MCVRAPRRSDARFRATPRLWPNLYLSCLDAVPWGFGRGTRKRACPVDREPLSFAAPRPTDYFVDTFIGMRA